MSIDIADDLISRCLDGRATADDVRRLEAQLECDADFRRAWLRVARLDALLHRVGHRPDANLTDSAARIQPLSTRQLSAARDRRNPRVAHGLPLAVGLAGIAVGIVGASLIWSTVVKVSAAWATAPERPADYRRIVFDDFEVGSGPQVTGLPARPGVWSGDQSELVGNRGNVVPRSGARMLRFASGWYDGKPTQDGQSCDVLKLIDLRPYRHQITSGTWSVRITAFFNVSTGAIEGREQCAVAGFAFDTSTAISLTSPGSLRDRSLAYACCQRIDLDEDADTWQQATTEFRLPAESAFLAVHCGVSEYSREADKPPKQFRGHYCDDVSVTLVRRPDVP
jgi:hypothetical protein